MDGLPHGHRVAELQEAATRGSGFFYPRMFGRRQLRAGLALSRSNPPQGAPGAEPSRNLDPFLALPSRRTGAAARRLVFVGRLTPEMGAADLLWAADAWAERHREQTIRLLWVGEGDLKDVLIGQPVADNLLQEFLPVQSPPQLATVFGRCGMLAAPMLAAGPVWPILAGMAAGLPVLASARDPDAARWVLHGRTGWLFEPRLPSARVQALEGAMATPDAALARMRESVRERAVAIGSTASVVASPRRRAVNTLPRGEPFHDVGWGQGFG